MQNPQYVKLAAGELKKRMPAAFAKAAPVGVILGTGLSDAAAMLVPEAVAIPFGDLPHFPRPSVESHAGRFLAGVVDGLPVLVQQGRCHLYEGRSPFEICMGVRTMGLAGCKEIIFTNAAGALNPLFETPGLMLMADMINHTGRSPLTGIADGVFGPLFPDMSLAFDPNLAKMARQCALAAQISLHEGVYIGVHGPEMETPAETRMYRQWGADAIGMSTVLEIIAARQLGISCLGISCLTNKNLPDCMAPAPLEAVLAAAADAGVSLASLLKAILRKIAGMRQTHKETGATPC